MKNFFKKKKKTTYNGWCKVSERSLLIIAPCAYNMLHYHFQVEWGKSLGQPGLHHRTMDESKILKPTMNGPGKELVEEVQAWPKFYNLKILKKNNLQFA